MTHDMAYKTFNSDRNDTHNWEEDKSLEGVFVQKRSVSTQNGLSNLYTVEKAGGKKVDVWGNTRIDGFLSNIPVGSMIKITYKGKAKSPKTGRMYHDYDFQYDDSTALATPENAELEFGK